MTKITPCRLVNCPKSYDLTLHKTCIFKSIVVSVFIQTRNHGRGREGRCWTTVSRVLNREVRGHDTALRKREGERQEKRGREGGSVPESVWTW
jgi:hypothetical protein